MKNTISRKIIASIMLTTFVFSNASLAAFAMEDAGIIQYGESAKPVIRQEVAENTLRLKGDVSFTDKNIPISISLRDSDVKQVLRMFADYHVHTAFSDDSIYPMEQVVQDAISKKIDEICFTEHVDYGIKVD